MVWGGTSAAQAAAAERRAEAQRVAALGRLLDDRLAASELLAATTGVITTAGEAASLALDSDEGLLEAHGALVADVLSAAAATTASHPGRAGAVPLVAGHRSRNRSRARRVVFPIAAGGRAVPQPQGGAAPIPSDDSLPAGSALGAFYADGEG